MAIVIRPYREPDRPAVRELTVAAFEGVSIDHNIDLRLGPIAGRDWRWRKSRDIDRDIDMLGAELAVAEDDETGAVVGYVTMQCDPETRIGWIHNLVVGAECAGPGAGPPVDRARPGAFPRRRHDGGQDRDARAERDRPAPVPVGRVHRGRPADPLRHAPDGSTRPMSQGPSPVEPRRRRAVPTRLEMRHISKSFGGVRALRDVSLTAQAGEVHALCGENGAGKSTLMKILAGAITDYEGEIRLDGRPVRFSGPREAEDAGIRIIYQELNLVPAAHRRRQHLPRPREDLGRPARLARRPRDGGRRRGGSSTGWARRSRRGPRSATCGSATSRWSRSPRRWPSTPRS